MITYNLIPREEMLLMAAQILACLAERTNQHVRNKTQPTFSETEALSAARVLVDHLKSLDVKFGDK